MEKVVKITRWACAAVIAVAVMLGFNRALVRCDNAEEGWVMVRQAYLDSIDMVLSLPPDTVTDTIFVKGDVVVVEKEVQVPIYIDPDSEVKKYRDVMVGDGIDAAVVIGVKGVMTDIKWEYKPLWREVITVVEKPVPYAVEKEVRVPVPQRGFYGVLGIGKGFEVDKPAVSAEVNYLTRKNSLIGVEAGYFQATYFKMKFGLRF